MKKFYKKKGPEFTGKNCPNCGKPLVYRTNKNKGTRFIGCDDYPRCKYTEEIYDEYCFCARTRVEKITDFIRAQHGWVPNCEDDVLTFIDKECDSGEEIKYFLGAAFFLDKGIEEKENRINLFLTRILYKNQLVRGIHFLEPFRFWDSPSPSAMAIVPQLEFLGKNSKPMHHDFGIFFSGEHMACEDQWEIGMGIEVDIDAMHNFRPDIDKYRDQQVSYPVFRLTKENDTFINWFSKIESYYSSKNSPGNY